MIEEDDCSSPVQSEQPFFTQENQLLNLFSKVANAKDGKEINEAEKSLDHVMNSANFVDTILKLIPNPAASKEIKLVAASFLHNNSEVLAKSLMKKESAVISALISLILSNLPIGVKEKLGYALQSFIGYNSESKNACDPIRLVRKKLKEMAKSGTDLLEIDSCLIIYDAYKEYMIQQQSYLFVTVLEPICLIAARYASAFNNITSQQLQQKQTEMLQKVNKIIEFVNENSYDVMQQGDQIFEIETSQYFPSFLQSFLRIFSSQEGQIFCHATHCPIASSKSNSLLSVEHCPTQICRSVLLIKQKILEIIHDNGFYKQEGCPAGVMDCIYQTLFQLVTVPEKGVTYNILCICLQLAFKQFQNHKPWTKTDKAKFIFTLFRFIVANQEEIRLIDENPERFIEYEDQCMYAGNQMDSDYDLKLSAIKLLQHFADEEQDGLRTIFDTVIAIIKITLSEDPAKRRKIQLDSEQALKCGRSQIAFYNLSSVQKLQTCFLILSLLQSSIDLGYPSLTQQIQKLFLEKSQIIVRITSPIVVLRIMRTLSCFPVPKYFPYIEAQIKRGSVFFLEGLLAFRNILLKHRFSVLLAYIASIFNQILKIGELANPIVRFIIENEYEFMVKGNQNRNRAIVGKIKNYFYSKQYGHSSENMNILQLLIEKETDERIVSILLSQFYEISSFCLQEETMKKYESIQKDIISIYTNIISSKGVHSAEIDQFAIFCLRKQMLYIGSNIFKFYNIYLNQASIRPEQLCLYFQYFLKQLQGNICNPKANLTKFILFLLCQIIVLQSKHTSFNTDQFKRLISALLYIETTEKNVFLRKQEKLASIILLLLSYLHTQPQRVVTCFTQTNLCELIIKVISINQFFNDDIFKKIVNLSIIHWLQVEQSHQTTLQLLRLFIRNVKGEIIKTKERIGESSRYIVKARQLPQNVDDQSMENEAKESKQFRQYTQIVKQMGRRQRRNKEDDNELVSIFVNFRHPLDEISEFAEFKRVFFKRRQGLEKQLSQQELSDIRTIIQTELVSNNKVRIMKKVNK